MATSTTEQQFMSGATQETAFVFAGAAAYFASAPDAAGVDKLGQIWSGLRRRDVFPVTLRSLQRFAGGEGHLINPSNLRLLIMRAAAAMLARRLEISTVS